VISDKEMFESLNNSVINIPIKVKTLEKDLKPEDIDQSMFYNKDDQLFSVRYKDGNIFRTNCLSSYLENKSKVYRKNKLERNFGIALLKIQKK
jgi:hypothetical protein